MPSCFLKNATHIPKLAKNQHHSVKQPREALGEKEQLWMEIER
jgi:hypothetical protein